MSVEIERERKYLVDETRSFSTNESFSNGIENGSENTGICLPAHREL